MPHNRAVKTVRPRRRPRPAAPGRRLSSGRSPAPSRRASSACRASPSSRPTGPTSSRRSAPATGRRSPATPSSGGSSSPGADIPAVVRNAIVATEDKNFYQHGGIDVRRTVSALVANLQQGGYAQGGSTLTQQLARAIFLSPQQDDLAQGQRGPRGLRDRAPVLQGPDPDDVRQRDLPRPRQLRRRGRVPLLLRQERQGRDARRGGAARRNRPAARGPVAVPQPRARARRGARRRCAGCARPATSPRPSARRPRRSRCRRPRRSPESIVGPYFCEEIRQYLEKTYGEKDLYRRGLRVESTLDPELQAWSEEALGWGLRQLSRRHGFHRPRNLTAEGYQLARVLRGPVVGRRRVRGGGDAARRRHVGRRLGRPRSGSGRRRCRSRTPASAWTGAPAVAKILKAGDLVTVTVRSAGRTAR